MNPQTGAGASRQPIGFVKIEPPATPTKIGKIELYRFYGIKSVSQAWVHSTARRIRDRSASRRVLSRSADRWCVLWRRKYLH